MRNVTNKQWSTSERKECSFPTLDIPRDPEPWVFQGGFGAELTVCCQIDYKRLICFKLQVVFNHEADYFQF